MGKKEKILKELAPLFEKAEKEGLWFYNSLIGEWYTPNELREVCIVLDSDSWKLRDPKERLNGLKNKKQKLEKEIKEIEKEIEETQRKIGMQI